MTKKSIPSAIFLKEKDLTRIKRRKIGEGTDASVYRAENGLLYKIYDKKDFADYKLYVPQGIVDEHGVRIAEKGKIVSTPHVFHTATYEDVSGTKLHSADVILKAAQRQPEVEKTRLPIAPIFVEDRFKGCVLQEHVKHRDLHLAWLRLSKENKALVLEQIINSVKELFDNYIYHINLSNNGVSDWSTELSHSNILLSNKLKPEIIDIDGSSAIYCEKKSDNYERYSCFSMNSLFLGLLFDFDLEADLLQEDLDFYFETLVRRGVPKELAYNLLYHTEIIEPTHELVDRIKKKEIRL